MYEYINDNIKNLWYKKGVHKISKVVLIRGKYIIIFKLLDNLCFKYYKKSLGNQSV